MRRILSALIIVLWGAWFGAMVQLFASVLHLFQTTPVEQAGLIASQMFHEFGKHELLVAGPILLLIVVWYAIEKSKLKMAVFCLVALAACSAVAWSMLLVPQMESLRANDQQHSAEFRRLHSQSMKLFAGEAALLLAAGVLLPAAGSQKKPGN